MTDTGRYLVRGSRERYRSSWMTVREDDVVFPDGSHGTYAVAERGDFSLIVPEVEPGALCLVRLYRHPVHAWFWEFPQGGSRHLTEPLAVARAELAEETGYTAGSWRRMGLLHEAYGYATSRCDVYLASDLTPGTAAPEPGETGVRHTVFPVSEIWSLVASGGITDAVTVAALGLYERQRESRADVP